MQETQVQPLCQEDPGEGNGNPLQYYCLENSMDRGAWWAAIYGTAKSWTRLSACTHAHTSKKWIYFFPGGSDDKESNCNAGDLGSIPGSGRSWRRKWQPIPEFLPGKSHGQRSLAGYSPRGWKELDTTSWLKKNNKNIHICVCVCVYTQRERMLFSH